MSLNSCTGRIDRAPICLPATLTKLQAKSELVLLKLAQDCIAKNILIQYVVIIHKTVVSVLKIADNLRKNPDASRLRCGDS